MKIAICSGGTGGHMFPATALLEELQKRGHQVRMITDERGSVFCKNVENKVILETIRFSRGKNFAAIASMFRVFLEVSKVWKKDTPDIIIGFGGLFTVIPSLVGKVFGAKLIIYEQNAVIGKANRLLSWIANVKLCTLFQKESWKIVPPPVRKEFLDKKKSAYICDFKIKIAVIGGSQGAASFSDIVPCALSMLEDKQKENIEIIQQVSLEKIFILQKKYDEIGIKASLETFIHNIAEEMLSSQLIICRSGASTLAELSAVGCPAILIPYPNASENHQLLNAMHYQDKGKAWIVTESSDIEKKLCAIIANIINDRSLLKKRVKNIMSNNKEFGEVFTAVLATI